MNLRADVPDTTGVGSVRFALNTNPDFLQKGGPPYAIGGDSPRGNYLPTPAILGGPHTVRATAYSGAKNAPCGTVLSTLAITFTINP